MSDPTARAAEQKRQADLRRRAASRLTGAAASKGPMARAADALGVLHALASSPDTAADALTLLHELQVHQVELDLQAQELRESRAELESALRRQIEIYDHLPVGLFTIDAQFVLHELNQTGAAMLGLGREEAFGLPLDTFVSAGSARRLLSAIAGLDAGAMPPSCALVLTARDRPACQVLASLSAEPGAKRYLVSLMNYGEAQQSLPEGH
jgi:PAS domain-containing protein